MTPEISEFSYGFALTNELVGWSTLAVAPIFPSLIEEGRKGGGYDVKLDFPAVPLFLQFKRADCMKRGTAKEINDYNLALTTPFYRFKITESGKSNQHKMLLNLDDGSNAVFYAAPRFHKIAEINRAWAGNEVASRSIFVKPTIVGPLDGESHHVAYDSTRAFLCSEPKEISILTAIQVSDILSIKLNKQKLPLRKILPDLINSVARAVSQGRGRRRADQRTPIAGYDAGLTASDQEVGRPISGVPTRSPKPLSIEQAQLRGVADTCGQDLGLQLVIVQRE